MTLGQFREMTQVKKVEETRGDNKYARGYKTLIEFVRIKFEI